jgi:CBS domain containing-hemolysin-like protein
MNISSDDYDTIGGFIFGALGRVPAVGDKVVVQDSGELNVTETLDRRVTRVKIVPFRRKRLRPGDESVDDEETLDETGKAESA